MILLGSPVGSRHILRIARDQFKRVRERHRPLHGRKLHFVYFSYSLDEQLITLSLESLVSLDSEILGSVTIVSDTKSPFSTEQRRALQRIYPALTFLDIGQIDWASLDTLVTELEAFGIVAESARDGDMIAKVDSDILFFNDKKLIEICRAGHAFTGDGHYSGYRYAQGGLYVMGLPLAKHLASLTRSQVAAAIDACGSQSEDRVVSYLAGEFTADVWLTRVMLFPDEYARVDFGSKWLNREFSTLHFVHRKQDMAAYADRLGGLRCSKDSGSDRTQGAA